MRKYKQCMRAETWTGCSESPKSERRILRSSSNTPLSDCSRTRGKFGTGKGMHSDSYGGSIIPGGRNGGKSRGVGLPAVWDYKALTEKYLTETDRGIWEERSIRVRRMYKTLAGLNAAELTIFLLVVELGSCSAVARRLKVHRSTTTRIYHRIEKKIHDELERY